MPTNLNERTVTIGPVKAFIASGSTNRSDSTFLAGACASRSFSICFKNENEGIAVGGDHNNPLNTSKTCFYTSDGGITWTESLIGIRGFRSCLLFKNGIYYSCGKNGIDYSKDNGVSWKPFADGNFFAMTSDKKYLYATTTNASFVKIKLVR